MNSHKNIDMELLDVGLKHSLKNWSSRNRAPEDGKRQLLLKAAQISKGQKSKKISPLIFELIGIDHIDLCGQIYHERLKLKEMLYAQCVVRLFC